MNRRRLGLRLVATYVIGLVAGLLLFAATAVFSIDRAERSSLDSQLNAASNAILPMIEVRNGRLVIDEEDEQQFLDVLGVRFSGVVEDASGRVVLSNVSRVPPALAKRLPAAPEAWSLGRGKDLIRVRALPVARSGVLYGAVIVWGPSEWIDETDLRTALAFAVATLLIAVFAAIAGNIVTKRALDDALQRQRRFTADASHELRAPLAVVMAEADFALAKEVRAPSEYAISLRAIQGEAMRMETLVDDLLWTTRTDEPAPRCVLEDLHALLDENKDRLETIVAAGGAMFRFEADGSAMAWIEGAAFLRAVFAVVHNAAKFAASRVEVLILGGAHHVDVSVLDDGPGFSEAGLVHATERFWREDRSREKSGNGLGLSIARSVVESCGGRLLIANQRSGGAIVTLRMKR